jgi:hypothetical protein
MAKERFTRTKPHVMFITMNVLARLGCSPLGVLQITRGLVVTDPKDRSLVAEMVSEFCKDNPSPGLLLKIQIASQLSTTRDSLAPSG